MRCGDDCTIGTPRLTLTPLQAVDAAEMAAVLDDERLHEFIGGRPATAEELRDRYNRLVAGSTRPEEVWLNWIVRRRSDGQALGTVQATVVTDDALSTASVAWVIGVDWQNQGFASEAAAALVQWLCRHRVDRVVAFIHPEHQASALVARRAGLESTDEQRDGEQVWRLPDDGLPQSVS